MERQKYTKKILTVFLVLAEELQLKGLSGNQTEKEAEVSPTPTKQKYKPKSPNYRSAGEKGPMNKDDFNENGLVQDASKKALVRINQATNNTDMESLDQQVKSMMTFSENADPYLKGRRARICKVCGKEGGMINIMDHIEAKHIAGISIPCGLCAQVFRTRVALRHHKPKYHRNE